MIGLGLGLGFQQGLAGSSFVPTDLSGCILWLRADLGTTIATGVSTWLDQSATGLSFGQAMGSAQPTTAFGINSQATLHFTQSAAQFLSAAHNSVFNLGAFTIYVVCKPNTTIAAYTAAFTKVSSFGSLADGWGIMNTDGAGAQYDIYSGVYTNGAACGAQASGTAGVLRATYDGATVAGFLNGSAGGTHVGTQVNNTSPLEISAAAGAGFSNIDIAEIIMFDHKQTSGDIASISAYTMSRYGIAA